MAFGRSGGAGARNDPIAQCRLRCTTSAEVVYTTCTTSASKRLEVVQGKKLSNFNPATPPAPPAPPIPACAHKGNGGRKW